MSLSAGLPRAVGSRVRLDDVDSGGVRMGDVRPLTAEDAAPLSPDAGRIIVPGPPGELFPGGGPPRGSVVALGPCVGPAVNHPAGRAGPVGGTASLTLSLLAAAAADGAWVAAVGLPGLGALAASELGVPLERLIVIPDPGSRWASVVAALVEAVAAVAVQIPDGRGGRAGSARPAGTQGSSSGSRPPRAAARPADCRRLAARARERRTLLLPVGPWDGADLTLTVTAASWAGVSAGSGRLLARELTVRAQGRGAASRPRESTFWLPGPPLSEAGAGNARSTARFLHPPRVDREVPA